MINRQQLNINITPELLKQVKQCAINAEMTVGDYVNNIIKCYLANQDLVNSNSKNSDRLTSLELKLEETKELLNLLLTNQNIDTKLQLNDQDAKSYCELLAKQFKLIAKENMISTKQAWNDFLKQKDAKRISKELIPIIQDTFREESVLSLNDLLSIIKEYNHCPVIPVLYTMANGDLIPELVFLSNKLVAAAIY